MGTAWKSKKKMQNVLILPNSKVFHIEKALKSKNTRGKKVYILAKDINT